MDFENFSTRKKVSKELKFSIRKLSNQAETGNENRHIPMQHSLPETLQSKEEIKITIRDVMKPCK